MAKSQAVTRTDRPVIAWAVLFCFFASGASGLVYQVVWVRELVLVFGATTFAVSTVLTAFMGGLALGSFYFGRRSESLARPLRLYGWLEIGIGLYGLAVPFIFAALPVIYHPLWRGLQLSFFTLSLVRFFFAALVLILPTALMGATLPVLASYYARDRHRIGLRVGSLYALNTFGAVIGAAVTGFALIPLLGMHATTATAAAINITLGLVALRISRLEESDAVVGDKRESGLKSPSLETPKKTPAVEHAKSNPTVNDNLSRRALIAVLVSFAVSGFIALAYEVIWSRVLALIIGSSVYAFSIMLTTFLIGLAAGAAVVSRFADRIRRPVMAFAVIEIGVGITSFIGAHLFNDLPYVFVQLYRIIGSHSFTVLLFARFLISALIMIGPTLLLGALFPLVVRIISTSATARTSGRTVGEAYAANTIGAIVGSFASGFFLIPFLGLLGSLRLCAALNFVVAAALFLVLPQRDENTATRRHGDTATGEISPRRRVPASLL